MYFPSAFKPCLRSTLHLVYIPAQLTSLSQCHYACLSTTHHYITAHASPILPLFPLGSHPFPHVYLAATPWSGPLILQLPVQRPRNTLKTSEPYPRADVSLLLCLPLYHGPIPISFIDHPFSASLFNFASPYIHACSCWLEEKVPLSTPYVGHS